VLIKQYWTVSIEDLSEIVSSAVPNVYNYNFIAHPQLDYDNKLKSKQSIKAGGSLKLNAADV
jgi:hypothetical protein